MIFCVVADTHGEIENLRKTFRKAVNNLHAETFIHLGDNYDDMRAVESENIEIIQVPGIFSSYYQKNKPDNRIIRQLEGWKFLLSHTPVADAKDLPTDINPQLTAQSDTVDVLLHGHTHIPEIATEPGYIRINPGNLRQNDKKGYPPTFCILDAQPNTLDIKIYQLYSDEIFLSHKFMKE